MREVMVLNLGPPLAGVAAGYVRGGRLSALAGRLRAWWLLYLAVAVQASQFYLDGVRVIVEDRWGVPMLAIVFGMVAVWLVVNARHWAWPARGAVCVVGMGAVLNVAPILANGGMPYSPQAAARVGLPPAMTTPKNLPAGDGTNLYALGDVMAVPPVQAVFSIGDVLIAAGAVVLVAASMQRGPRVKQPTRGEEVTA